MAREFRMSEGLKLIWKQADIISKNEASGGEIDQLLNNSNEQA
jgi:hypothetical protein